MRELLSSLSFACRKTRLSCEIFRVSTPPNHRSRTVSLSVWRCNAPSLPPSLGGWENSRKAICPHHDPHRCFMGGGRGWVGLGGKKRRRFSLNGFENRLKSQTHRPSINLAPSHLLPSPRSSFIYFGLSNCKFLGARGGRDGRRFTQFPA